MSRSKRVTSPRSVLVSATVVTVLLALAGCGGGNSSGGSVSAQTYSLSGTIFMVTPY